MNLGNALRFPFRGPHAWANIGLLFVCFLIPIIGPIVAGGFQCGVEKMLVFNPDADPPPFDFGKFGQYLQRGVMPFVAALLSSLALLPIVFVLGGGTALAVALVFQDHPWAAAAIIFVAVILWVIMAIVFNLLMTPIAFRAGVQGVIMPAFEKDFVLDFIRRVGWRMLLFHVQIFLLTLPVIVLACIPPAIYAVMGILLLVHSHGRVQLYNLYLARGGRPLAIVPEQAAAAFPVVVWEQYPPTP